MTAQKSQKQQLYEHVKMFHPDGTLMCCTSIKRAKWFINKELAHWITTNKEFQLNFVPAGYGKSSNPFYTQEYDNCCVCCGRRDNLNKHHVFPRVFRKHMPIMYKSSTSYDVLPICLDCHEEYETEGNKLKASLAQDFLGIKKLEAPTDEAKINIKILRARKFLENLDENFQMVRNGKVIRPPENVIKKYQLLASMEIHTQNADHWGKMIMDKVLFKKEEQKFVELWRQHFLDTMKPKHMPMHWHVHQPLEKTTKVRTDIKLNEQDYKVLHLMQIA